MCQRQCHRAAFLLLLVAQLGGAVDFHLNTIDQGDAVTYAGGASYYARAYDVCGVCMGDNATCTDCAGTTFKPLLGERAINELDLCGTCLDVDVIEKQMADADARRTPLACMDCDWVVNGTKQRDICNLCLEPADPDFGQTCLGCDGIAFSDFLENACGACVPLARVNNPCSETDSCCDCNAIPYGNATQNFCCECQDLDAFPPPLNMTVALTLFEEAKSVYDNATEALRDLEGPLARYASQGLSFPRSTHILSNMMLARGLLEEAWERLAHPDSNDNSTCWYDVYIMQNATSPRDMCGECFGNNATCLGCTAQGDELDIRPIVYGLGDVFDDCGVCGGNNQDMDACGQCFGDNSTCLGECELLPNSRKVVDACEECTEPEVFEASCAAGANCCGCDGVPNSGLIFDACGECVDPTNQASVNATCRGCDLVPNSGAVYDACCQCYDPNAPPDPSGNTTAVEDMTSQCFRDMFDFYPNVDIERFLEERKASSGQAPPAPETGTPSTGGEEGEPLVPTAEEELALQYYDAAGALNESAIPFLDLFPTADAQISIPGGFLVKNNIWSLFYTECGECRAWGSIGRLPCGGCQVEGQPRRAHDGMHYDACGVCGGDCACAPECGNATHCIAWQVPGDDSLDPPQVSPPDQEPYRDGCVRPSMIGPNSANDLTGSPWYDLLVTEIVLCPDSTANYTYYEQYNAPPASVPLWPDLVRTECRPWQQPPPPPDPRDDLAWVVRVNGRESRPYSIRELEAGFIEVVDPLTDLLVDMPLTPETQIAKISNEDLDRTLRYGVTSNDQGRAEVIKQKYLLLQPLLRPNTIPGAASTPNNMRVVNKVTVLRNNSFFPMGEMQDLEGVVYPFCTGSTWRGEEHRLHGKKSGGNFLGLITTANITLLDGTRDRPWNPDVEYIYDVPTTWHDQQCVCQEDWYFNQNLFERSEAVPPTCERRWQESSEWIESEYRAGPEPGIYGGDALEHATLAGRSYTVQLGGTQVYGRPERLAEGDEYTLASSRSLADSPWKVQAGWWAQDFGGDLNRRGPWRKGSFGRMTLHSTTTVLDLARDRCYTAARLSEPRRNTSGAAWYSGQRLPVASAWEALVEFTVSDRSQQCDVVNRLSRSFSEETRTDMHSTCKPGGADGFALVVLDAHETLGPSPEELAAVVGGAGGGLGYEGLAYSLAVEVDTWFNAEHHEPYEGHVAVHTRGPLPNSAHHRNRLGATTEIPDVSDGAVHQLRVVYEPNPTLEQQVATIELGSLQGSSIAVEQYIAGGQAGLLTVYMDGGDSPDLAIPLTMSTILRPNSTTAWLGLTASTGESWQFVDVRLWNMTFA